MRNPDRLVGENDLITLSHLNDAEGACLRGYNSMVRALLLRGLHTIPLLALFSLVSGRYFPVSDFANAAMKTTAAGVLRL